MRDRVRRMERRSEKKVMKCSGKQHAQNEEFTAPRGFIRHL